MSSYPEVLAIIPARGGSKGIKRKNIISFNGRPLISYMIESGLNAKSISHLYVSTDDIEIASISESCGAKILHRPAEISGDNDSSELALLHALMYLKENDDYVPDLVVMLQCTSPLTLAEDIDGTVAALLRNSADCSLTVTRSHRFIWAENDQGEIKGVNHDSNIRKLRQEIRQQYMETGAVYVMKTKGFLESKHRFFGKISIHITPSVRGIEIDELHDLKLAEFLVKEREFRKN